MGITYAKVLVSNARHPGADAIELDMLVDSGAIFSVLPRSLLEQIGVAALDHKEFALADGAKHRYPVGEAYFETHGNAGTSKVVFGPEGVPPLLGALTLESLGLMLNPITRELLEMRLYLSSHAEHRA